MATLDTFRRGILPKSSNTDMQRLLWNCTPFPLAKDVRKLRRALREHLKQGGGTVEGAINYAHQEMDREFDEYQKRRGRA